MASGTTYQAIKRIAWLPEREAAENGSTIGGQEYDDVYIIGGAISNVVLTDVTINGVPTAPTLREIIAPGDVTVLITDYTIYINKTSPEATNIFLPSATPANRRLQVICNSTVSGVYPVTITPNGGDTITGFSTLLLETGYQAVSLISLTNKWGILA